MIRVYQESWREARTIRVNIRGEGERSSGAGEPPGEQRNRAQGGST